MPSGFPSRFPPWSSVNGRRISQEGEDEQKRPAEDSTTRPFMFFVRRRAQVHPSPVVDQNEQTRGPEHLSPAVVYHMAAPAGPNARVRPMIFEALCAGVNTLFLSFVPLREARALSATSRHFRTAVLNSPA